MSVILSVIFFAIGVAIYLLPTLAAGNKNGKSLVFLINLLTGWTIIGWIVAGIMAISLPTNRCSLCHGEIDKNVKRCKKCGGSLN